MKEKYLKKPTFYLMTKMNILKFLDDPTPEVYTTLPHITLDLETTNIDIGDPLSEGNDIVLSCIGDKHIWGGVMDIPSEILDTLEEDVFLVGHNIKFDLKWLAKAGLDLTKVLVWDTMIAEKVLLGNNPYNLPLDLGTVAQRYGLPGKEEVVDTLIKGGVCPSQIPSSLLLDRCQYDVRVTDAVFKQQLEACKDSNRLGVVLTRCILTPVLADIEIQGMSLDHLKVKEEWESLIQRLADVNIELDKVADINWNSPKQKRTLLYTDYKFKPLCKNGKPVCTPAGELPTGIDVVQRLKATTKRQKKLKEMMLEQAKVTALLKTVSKFKECVDNDDILYAYYTQHVAKTHRLSSRGSKYKLQFQNMNRKYKGMFIPKQEGWLMGECDGANLEFRIAAELGKDAQALADILDPDFDAHTVTATALTEAGQPTTRQDAKSRTFKPLYGGSSGTKAEQAYYALFNAKYKGIVEVQESWKRQALNTKEVVLPWGLILYFPYTKINNGGYQVDSTNICNWPIQSFATADIIPIALTHLWHSLKHSGLRATIVNTIHDSVIMEAHPDDISKINDYLVNSFTKVCYNYSKKVYNLSFTVPLGVGIKWGSHWSEGEEINIDIPNSEI